MELDANDRKKRHLWLAFKMRAYKFKADGVQSRAFLNRQGQIGGGEIVLELGFAASADNDQRDNLPAYEPGKRNLRSRNFTVFSDRYQRFYDVP